MTRIGRQIPHFELVETESIEAVFSSDKCYRYRLTVEYRDTLLDRERRNSVAVILKNPSAADEKMADATIRKVETFVYHRFSDVRWVHILNIFAYRATDPGDLNRMFRQEGAMSVIGMENDHFIRSTLTESDRVILSWGNHSGIDRVLYEERIYRVKQVLQELPAGKLYVVEGRQKTKHPLHGLMWGYDYAIAPVLNYLEKNDLN
ncbi:MAG: DUF1643 domain-containing protein [Bacteroidales bacterium]|nr:DUF1643 domain-containing protein [Bacteroidales bacterium]